MLRRAIATAALAAALLISTAGAALGHECFIVSRSDTGDAHATNSGVWIQLTIRDVFAFILPQVLGAPPLSPSQLAWALQTAAAQGIPNAWVIRADKTIGEGSSNPNLADGKGLDHLADVYGAQAAAIYFAALQQP
jgi:hypothetical protein